MLLWLSRTLAFVSIGLIGWAVWAGAFASVSAAERPLEIDWPAPDLGRLGVGSHEIIVRITNSGGRPRRVIGMTNSCGPNGCIGPKTGEQVVVFPGGTVDYPCLLEIHQPTPFDVTIHLFLEDNGIREAETTLHGIGVATGGGTHAAK